MSNGDPESNATTPSQVFGGLVPTPTPANGTAVRHVNGSGAAVLCDTVLTATSGRFYSMLDVINIVDQLLQSQTK